LIFIIVFRLLSLCFIKRIHGSEYLYTINSDIMNPINFTTPLSYMRNLPKTFGRQWSQCYIITPPSLQSLLLPTAGTAATTKTTTATPAITVTTCSCDPCSRTACIDYWNSVLYDVSDYNINRIWWIPNGQIQINKCKCALQFEIKMTIIIDIV